MLVSILPNPASILVAGKLSKTFVDNAFEISQVLPSLVKLHPLLDMIHALLDQASDTVIQLIDMITLSDRYLSQ